MRSVLWPRPSRGPLHSASRSGRRERLWGSAEGSAGLARKAGGCLASRPFTDQHPARGLIPAGGLAPACGLAPARGLVVHMVQPRAHEEGRVSGEPWSSPDTRSTWSLKGRGLSQAPSLPCRGLAPPRTRFQHSRSSALNLDVPQATAPGAPGGACVCEPVSARFWAVLGAPASAVSFSNFSPFGRVSCDVTISVTTSCLGPL